MTKPITDRPLKSPGRKLKEPPANAAHRIEALSADGFSVLGIAKHLNTTPDVFRRWLDEYPDLKDAMDSGREIERHALHNMLFKAATEGGNTSAAMFLLKARHGYREGDQSEQGNRVSINFQLPAAMPMADFKVIEHGKSDNRIEPVSTALLGAPRRS